MKKTITKGLNGGLRALAGLLALCSIQAYAGVDGKIFMNGRWVEAVTARSFNAWNASALFPSADIGDAAATAKNFIKLNADALSLKPGISLKVENIQSSELLQTVRISKRFHGLEVMGGESLVHLSNGEVSFANMDATNLDALSAAPALSAEKAQAIAFAAYNGNAESVEAPSLKVIVLNKEEGRAAALVYEVTVRDRDGFSSDIHFVDAQSGNIVMSTTNVETIKERRVKAASGTEDDFNLDESQWKLIYADKGCSSSLASLQLDLFDAKKKTKPKPTPVPPSNGGANACNKVDAKVMNSALSAWNNSSVVYDYYQSKHSRDSIDGRGMSINSVVNFGSQFDNAAWVNDKGIMIYGMGDGTEFNDFASALDVAGHELTHGVTARTASLTYADESGALNESYSDVFGKLVAFSAGKTNDWKLGKELFKDHTSFIRDMENPEIGNYKDYKYKGETCSRMNDFCGVHTNSGIGNKAAVLIANKLGLDKLGKLYYLTLTQLLRSSTNFKEARAQTEAACSKLFGADSSDCKAVSDAFTAVGVM